MAGSALVWFRDDHRVSDHPALTAAVASGLPVLCCYIFDEASPGVRPLGGASRWWLHGSLRSLAESIGRIGGELLILAGPAREVIGRVVDEAGIAQVFWNRRYGPAESALDRAIETDLRARGVPVHRFNGRLLHEPGEVLTKSGSPFQVFTPYLRAVLAREEPAEPLPAPSRLTPGQWPTALRAEAPSLAELQLEPTRPDWARTFHEVWVRGEAAAQERLHGFLGERLRGYADNRNLPAADGTSRLSPHLRFGEISPRQVWHAALHVARSAEGGLEADAQKLLSEVIWRDFCTQLLHDHPDLPVAHTNRRFDRFPFLNAPADLAAWRRGRTGYPIVDAGLRQLWRHGWMHNRVRMITASFLVKHLLVDWREGEAWFWDTLVDADPATNAFSWQWVAGSGPDSAPFHRIFNPVSQGEKFDPKGDYVRGFVPELSGLASSVIHRPWEASASTLAKAGVTLGETYPGPIVAHEAARARALEAFRSTRSDRAA